MKREYRSSKRQPGTRRRNVAAAMIAGGALAFLYYSFEPVAAEDNHPVNIASVDKTDLSSLPESVTQSQVETQLVPNPSETEPVTKATSNKVTELTNRYALLFMVSQLERGIEKLEEHDCYSVTFERLERIDGVLHDQQEIDLKVRHAPFSVYMKWRTGDKGRQLLFTEKENDGRMLVKLGGLKGRFLPTIKLDPEGSRAMAESRHSVAQAGIVNLARELILNRQKDLKLKQMPSCVITENVKFNEQPCTQIVVEYRSAEDSPVYRRTITMIDNKLHIPVYVRNYTWPTEDTVDVEEETLIECYCFKDLQLNEQLADVTWKKSNPRYRFR